MIVMAATGLSEGACLWTVRSDLNVFLDLNPPDVTKPYPVWLSHSYGCHFQLLKSNTGIFFFVNHQVTQIDTY